MTIRTNREKEFNAVWFGETLDKGSVFGEITPSSDVSFLSDIIDDFEGLKFIDRFSENEGNVRFNVRSKLRSINWTDRGTIRLEFEGVEK